MQMNRRAFARGLFGGGWAAVPGAMVSGAARAAAKAQTGAFGLDLASVDTSVAAGDGFFRHVNGGWLKTAQIPADRSSWTEFSRLAELNAGRVHAILEDAAATPKTPEARQVGYFYASLMDEAEIERRGLSAITPDLQRVAAIANRADLSRA